MKKILFALTLTAILSGCASVEPNMRDGKEYVGDYPVLYKGTVQDFQFEDESGVVHSLAKGTSDTLATGTGSVANLANMATGMSSMGGGLIAGVVGAFAEAIANSNAPKPPQIVIKKDNGEIVSIATQPHLMEEAVKFRCLDIGEPAKVINIGTPYLYVMHDDPRLRRTTILDASCESLREKFNVPLKRSKTDAQ